MHQNLGLRVVERGGLPEDLLLQHLLLQGLLVQRRLEQRLLQRLLILLCRVTQVRRGRLRQREW